MSKEARFVVSLIAGLVLLAFAGAAMWLRPAVLPAEAQAWATPQGAAFGGGDWVMATWVNSTTMSTTAKVCGNGLQTAAYVLADLQSIGDFATTDEYVTCTLEFSNDNTHWCTHMYTLTQFTTDTIRCDQFHLFGRYSRVCCQSDGTDWYTMTHRAKLYN